MPNMGKAIGDASAADFAAHAAWIKEQAEAIRSGRMPMRRARALFAELQLQKEALRVIDAALER
jgi:hypothetical protein